MRKKKTKKKSQKNNNSMYMIFGIALILLIVTGLVLNFGLFQQSIFEGNNLPYNQSLSSSEFDVTGWSSFPFGSSVYLFLGGEDLLLTEGEPFRLDGENCPGGLLGDPELPCARSAISREINLTLRANSINYNYIGDGLNERASSISKPGGSFVMALNNNRFNTDIAEEFEFIYDASIISSGNYQEGGNSRLFGVYLANENRDINLIDFSYPGDYVGILSESGIVKITKNPVGIGFILDVNGQQSNLNIPIGEYMLFIVLTGSGDAISSISRIEMSMSIENILIKNTDVITTVYRIVNDLCEELQINQNDVLSTDFDNLEDCQLNIEQINFPINDTNNGTTANKSYNCCGYSLRVDDSSLSCEQIQMCFVCPDNPLTKSKCEEQLKDTITVEKPTYTLLWILGSVVVFLLITITIILVIKNNKKKRKRR